MTGETELAGAFARAIVAGNSAGAYEMLSADARSTVSAADLSAQFDVLAEEMGGVTGIGEPAVILTEWPAMSASDRAMVYVPLEGDVYSEAVIVTVASTDGALKISGVEWGRP